MQQKWWLVAAGVVGIALAILLFPKPEADNLPDADLTRANPLDFKGKEKPKGPSTTRVGRREALPPDISAARAARAVGMEHLTTPEAIFAGRLSGPWTLVRRQLLAKGDDKAKAWAETVTPLVTDLRNRRRDPKSVNFDDLRARQDKLLAELKAQPTWLAIEGVAVQADRIEDLMTGYDQAKTDEAAKAAGTAPAAPGAPAPGSPAPVPPAPVPPAPTPGAPAPAPAPATPGH